MSWLGDVWGAGSEFLGGVGGFFSDLVGETDLLKTLGGIAGLSFDTYSTIAATDAAFKAGQSRADVYMTNAELLDREALNVEQRTSDAVTIQRYNGHKLLASQQMSYLKSGVTLEGSPLIVLEETQKMIEFEILQTQEAGQQLADRYRGQAKAQVKAADAAIDESAFKAESIAVGGAEKTLTRLFDF